jgi:2-polyprenyl-3-methyl-5-hydroxy-6-metoxy-1,4-benzoquinol methylase
MGAFYPDNYGPYVQPTKPSHTASESRFMQSLKGMTKMILRLLAKPSYQLPEVKSYPIRLLDYGCASGGYLASLDKNDYDTLGIDFSESALNKARCLGLNVLSEPLPVDRIPQASFDIITAWMVIEHLYDPVETLQKLSTWLRDDGFFVLSVPDHSSLLSSIFKGFYYDNHVPAHLLHFTPHTISALLKEAGFEIVSLCWQSNSSPLVMSAKHFFDAYMPESARLLLDRLMQTKRFKTFSFMLGYILAVIHQSGRMRITAQKALSSY